VCERETGYRDPLHLWVWCVPQRVCKWVRVRLSECVVECVCERERLDIEHIHFTCQCVCRESVRECVVQCVCVRERLDIEDIHFTCPCVCMCVTLCMCVYVPECATKRACICVRLCAFVGGWGKIDSELLLLTCVRVCMSVGVCVREKERERNQARTHAWVEESKTNQHQVVTEWRWPDCTVQDFLQTGLEYSRALLQRSPSLVGLLCRRTLVWYGVLCKRALVL